MISLRLWGFVLLCLGMSSKLSLFSATPAHGTLVSNQNLKPCLHYKHRVPSARPPGKSPDCAFIFHQLKIFFFNGVKTPPFNLQGGVLAVSEHWRKIWAKGPGFQFIVFFNEMSELLFFQIWLFNWNILIYDVILVSSVPHRCSIFIGQYYTLNHCEILAIAPVLYHGLLQFVCFMHSGLCSLIPCLFLPHGDRHFVQCIW